MLGFQERNWEPSKLSRARSGECHSSLFRPAVPSLGGATEVRLSPRTFSDHVRGNDPAAIPGGPDESEPSSLLVNKPSRALGPHGAGECERTVAGRLTGPPEAEVIVSSIRGSLPAGRRVPSPHRRTT
jgi:hypothetical protein